MSSTIRDGSIFDRFGVDVVVVALLLASSLVRLILVVQGGQLYWPDERLYVQVLELWSRPSWFETVKGLLSTADHFGFAVIAFVPAGLQHAIGAVGVRGDDRLYAVPALMFSQASVIAIALTAMAARRAGASQTEARLVAAMMAAAASVFYYSRHLLPYDTALVLALAALCAGLRPRLAGVFVCGSLAACALVTYNGYWLLTGIVLTVSVLHGASSLRSMLTRAVVAMAGVMTVPMAITVAQVIVGAPLLVGGMRRLAGTVSDGYFPEGFLLPWAYLWSAEHALLLVWVSCAVFVVVTPGLPVRRRALMWLAAAGCGYLALSASAAVLHVFVVMGRQARQLVPLLCLGTAPVLAHLLAKKPSLGRGIAVVLLAIAAFNFHRPLLQRFPRDLEAEVSARFGAPDHALTVSGPSLLGERRSSRWVLVNAQHLYPPRGSQPAPPGLVLSRFNHPLSFVPYQFEGFDPLERSVLRSVDISMQLIDAGPGDR